MGDTKSITVFAPRSVTIFAPGRTASTVANIGPGDSVEQILQLVLSDLALPSPSGFQYQMVKAGTVLTGDLYKAVADGDELELRRVEFGGSKE
jgi:hypothetical protein